MKKLYKTKKGMSDLNLDLIATETELTRLQSTMDSVMDQGNQWHDNAAYDQLLIDIRSYDKKLEDLHNIKNNSIVVNNPSSNDKVQIGSIVSFDQNGDEIEYEIVGHMESDIGNNKIAYDTPLGKILMGKKVGDDIQASFPGKDVDIEILTISI